VHQRFDQKYDFDNLPQVQHKLCLRAHRVATFHQLGNGKTYRIVDIKFILDRFNAVLAASQESDQKLIVRSTFDVWCADQPVFDSFDVGQNAIWDFVEFSSCFGSQVLGYWTNVSHVVTEISTK
jgi:hypothetical protein